MQQRDIWHKKVVSRTLVEAEARHDVQTIGLLRGQPRQTQATFQIQNCFWIAGRTHKSDLVSATRTDTQRKLLRQQSTQRLFVDRDCGGPSVNMTHTWGLETHY